MTIGPGAHMIRTDEELVASATAGDLESFNQLVVRWERPIYALAYRVIGREEDARDVAQETFLRAFRALGGFKGQAKFSSWLYRITLNLCRDWIRRERRTPVAQAPEGVDLIELAGEATPSESIEDLVSRKELGRAVAKAMSYLPDEQRTAIILKEYHGLTFQDDRQRELRARGAKLIDLVAALAALREVTVELVLLRFCHLVVEKTDEQFLVAHH